MEIFIVYQNNGNDPCDPPLVWVFSTVERASAFIAGLDRRLGYYIETMLLDEPNDSVLWRKLR